MGDVISVVPSKYDRIFEVFADSYLDTIKAPAIVVDDGLSRTIKQKYSMFRYIESPKPFAFCLSVNAGIIAAGGADILLFNDDCYIHTKEADKILHNGAYSDKRIGLVAPMMTNVQNRDQLVSDVKSAGVFITKNNITFVCVYMKRSIITEVGLLDEEYRHGVADREDIDYCVRVRQAGYELGISPTCFVEHGGSRFGRTISNTRFLEGQMELAHRNREYFTRKWGHG